MCEGVDGCGTLRGQQTERKEGEHMFICNGCGTQSKKGEKSTTQVVETREKTYHDKGRVIGHGWEIKKEIKLGSCCKAEK